jgi:hypothetical protein
VLSTEGLSRRIREYYRTRAVKDGSVAEYDQWSERLQASLAGLKAVDTAFVWHVLAVGRDGARGYAELYHLKEKRTALFPEKSRRAEAAILRAVRTLLGLGRPRISQAFGSKFRKLARHFYRGLEYLESRLTEVTVVPSDIENWGFRRRHAPEWDAELTGYIVCLMEALQDVPKPERWVADLLESSRLFRGQRVRGRAGDRWAFVKKRNQRAMKQSGKQLFNPFTVATHLRSSFDGLQGTLGRKK